MFDVFGIYYDVDDTWLLLEGKLTSAALCFVPEELWARFSL